jgi:hypothetical protein
MGTVEYGNKGCTKTQWSIKFDQEDFSQILLITEDKSKWMIMSKEAVQGNSASYANPKVVL